MKSDLILVTGAAGFIGSNLTEDLLRRGYRVRALIKNGESTKNLSELVENPNLELVRGNILDKPLMAKICKDVTIVYHLAAKTDLFTKNYRSYYRNNFIGTKNIVESVGGRLKKFVYFSSILAVGLPNIRTKLNEKYFGVPSNYYGESKKITEDYLIDEYRTRSFPVVIFRPSTVYGPRETAVQYYLFKVIREHKFALIGNGKNLNSYVYVKNITDACLRVLKFRKTSGQIYFISDSHPYPFLEIVTGIARISGTKLPEYKIPFWLAYAGSFFYSKLCIAVGIKPLIYPSRVKTMVLNYAYSVKKAKDDFGYEPKYNLLKGLSETYAWYKKTNYL